MAAAASVFGAGRNAQDGRWRKAAWPVLFVASHTAYLRLWVLTTLAGALTFALRVAVVVSIASPSEFTFGPAHFVLLEGASAFLFAPIAGALIDLLSPRRALVGVELARVAGLAAFVLFPSPLLFPVLVPFLAGCVVLHQAARDACVLDTVEVSEAAKASGLDQVASALAIIAGPLLGSALLVVAGLQVTLAAVAVVHLLLAALASRLPSRRRARRPGLSIASEMILPRASLSRLSYPAMAVFMCGALAGSLWLAAAPAMMVDVFHASAAWLGVQMTLAGIAASLGALAAPTFIIRHGHVRIMTWTALFEAAGMALYGVSGSLAAANLFIAIVGFAAGAFISAFYAYLQTFSCDCDRGRLFALVRQADAGAICLAGAIGLYGKSGSFAGCALVLVAITYFSCAMILLVKSRINQIDHLSAAP